MISLYASLHFKLIQVNTHPNSPLVQGHKTGEKKLCNHLFVHASSTSLLLGYVSRCFCIFVYLVNANFFFNPENSMAGNVLYVYTNWDSDWLCIWWTGKLTFQWSSLMFSCGM